MRFHSLEAWLRWQEELHPRDIELGLERVRTVLRKLPEPPTSPVVITVGGTNGKGSTVAILEAVLGAAGYRTGAYTSPHLLRYNERIRVDGLEVADETICEAFERIDQARGGTSLTYFEFGTLAAIDIFRQAPVDVAVMEVGLGGRLDAVNVLDADAAVVTTVDIDHTDWLGDDRNAIGREKAGIFRPGRPAIHADPDAPVGLVAAARDRGAEFICLGKEFDATRTGGAWTWRGFGVEQKGLPLPLGGGQAQLNNAAGALAVLWSLRHRLPVDREAIRDGLRKATLPARMEVRQGSVVEVLDVAHNPQAAQELAAFLRDRPCKGRTLAVFGMLSDKDISGVVRALSRVVDVWHVAGLEVPRGASAAAVATALTEAGARGTQVHASVGDALKAARETARETDRIVIVGSFHTVALAMAEPYNRASVGTRESEVAP